MTDLRVIEVEELTEERFAPYGRIVQLPSAPAPRRGPGWECWFGPAELQHEWPFGLGMVLTRPREILVAEMERHTFTVEYLYTHDHDLIQPLALPLENDREDARPDPNTVLVFRIRPGQGIIMHPGTWHSPAFPLSRACTYGFACAITPYPYTPEWVKFQGDVTITAVVR